MLTRTGTEVISNVGEAWSPNGKQIAFGSYTIPLTSPETTCTIKSLDLQNGTISALSQEKWDACYRMVWTRDGEGLIFIGTKFHESYPTRRDKIYYLSTSTGESHRIPTDDSRHQAMSLGLTDNGGLLSVPYNRSSQIWAMNSNGDERTAIRLTSGMADGRSGIVPLADGRLSYLTLTGDDLGIWTMNGDGSDRRQLTSEPSFLEELRATSDGRYFVFSTRRDNHSHLFRVDADGTNLKQLTDGQGQEIDSAISPDGKWIVCASSAFTGTYGKTTLQKLSIDGGEPIKLTDMDSHAPHFSPDGRFISFITDENKIAIISAENGTLIRTYETAQVPSLNIGAHWTPDGRALTYIVNRKNTGNIWLQPLSGDAPHSLTDFTSGDIYNYAFSADGTRLYLARGYQIQDAVLIRNF